MKLAWAVLAGGLLQATPVLAEPPARMVGAAVCAQCHASQAAAWQASHHQLALQPASRAGAVLAPFKGESFTAGGVTSSFRQAQGRFFVRTDGVDGRPQEFEVTQAIGHFPLQQYLVPRPDGSLHALDLAWDARDRAAGGQRWMQLPTGAAPGTPREQWHWSGTRMNANTQCIDCHVTGFEKKFDVATRRYATSWSEGNVSCEACHGAGSRHVDWARNVGPGRAGDPRDMRKGLLISFDERRGVRWPMDPATGNATRSIPPTAARPEVQACARCHSHRSRLADDAGPQVPLMDAFLPSVAEPDLYWPDGQMRAEVYNHGSFLQSRMHGKGVTCSDCHDPHTAKLRLPGNATCLQCHAPARYEAKAHHFHRLGGAGAQCAACHMPPTTYMAIDPRHDHFIRVPQPAQSEAAGSPDACTQCHRGQPRAWAIAWTRRWYLDLERRRSPLAAALSSMSADDAPAIARLGNLMRDPQQPAFPRASALQALPGDAGPSAWQAAAQSLADDSPLVRRAAVRALREADAQLQARRLAPLLDDPVLAVRLDAARALAPLRATLPDPRPLDRVLAEYIASQAYNADLPESYENLGTLWMDLGEWARAEAALKQALLLAPWSATARLNLADFYRATGREAACEQTARALLQREPRNAAAHHALGLSLLRQKKLTQALPALRQAAALSPQDARFAFVHAIALDSAGRTADARAVLQATARMHPRNVEVIRAQLALARREADAPAVQRHATELQRAMAAR